MRKEEIDKKRLPSTLQEFIKRYPNVWSADENLGLECIHAGPLSQKQIQLIKIAVTLETAFKMHVKKAVQAGASKHEIEHTIIQLLPIVGMGRTLMAMKWYQGVTPLETDLIFAPWLPLRHA